MSAAAGTAGGHARSSGSRAVAAWLLACCALLGALVVVGGATRLTQSGLSITEWRPVRGILPPLDDAQWQAELDRYRQSPEARIVNPGITLEAFRRIFWWEYAHRLLARLVGLAFLLPYLWFLLRGALDRRLARRLGGVLLLGAAQGALGWWMVASGLVAEPRVSHFRLAAHLGLAFALFAALLWLALGQARGGVPVADPSPAGDRRLRATIVGLVVLQSLAGALVAGSRAGLLYPTFPLMDGHWLPHGLRSGQVPLARALHDPGAIQVLHRTLAWILLLAVIALWWRAGRGRSNAARGREVHALLAATCLQFTLGVATLLGHLPLSLALAHQAGALLLLAAAVVALRAAVAPRAAQARAAAASS